MGLYTEKTTITRDEYLRLVGLLALGAELRKQENALIASVASLLGEKPGKGHATDALWELYSADQLLGKSGITVVDNPAPSADDTTEQTHQERHVFLHRTFDELLADFINQNAGKRPSTTTITELMEWSYQQTIAPEES